MVQPNKKFSSFEAFSKDFLSTVGGTEADAAATWLTRGDLFEYKPPQEEKGILSDTGTALKSGWYGLGASMRGVARFALPEAVFNAIDSLDGGDTPQARDQSWAEGAAKIQSQFSERGQAARAASWWREEGEEDKQSAWTNPLSYWLALVESVPGTVATMGPAGLIARTAAVRGAAAFAESAAGRAVGEKAAAEAIAKGLTAKEARDLGAEAMLAAAQAKGGDIAGRVAWGAGSVLEGAQQGGATMEAIRAEIDRMPLAVLQKSDAFNALVEGGMSPEEAKAALRDDVATQAFLTTALTTGIFGGAGDRMMMRAFQGKLPQQILKRIGVGAVSEGLLEEAPQGFFSSIAENIAMQKADPSRGTYEGAVGEALGGAVVGGLMGGGIATVFGGGAPAEKFDLQARIDQLKQTKSVDEAAAVARQWSAERSAAVQTEMARLLNQPVGMSDLFADRGQAEIAALEARGAGQEARVDPFEVNIPAGWQAVEKGSDRVAATFPDEATGRKMLEGGTELELRPVPGETEPGFLLNRQKIPGLKSEQGATFEYQTEGAARQLDPTGLRREVVLSPNGFSSRPVDATKVQKNMADLSEALVEEGKWIESRAEEARKDGRTADADTISNFAKVSANTVVEPAAAPKNGSYATALAEQFGTEVQWVSIKAGVQWNGKVLPGKDGGRVLYLNVDAKRPHLSVIGHEVAHRMRQQYPDIYDRVAKDLVPLFKQKFRAELESRYKGVGLSTDSIEEEMVADMFGGQLANKTFVRLLAKKDPGLFKELATRILEVLDSVLQAIKDGALKMMGKDAVTDINRAREHVAAALQEFGARVRTEREGAARAAAAEAVGAKMPSEKAQTGEAAAQPGTTAEGLPMMALDGRMIKLKVQVAETGKTATITVDAGAEMKSLEARESALNKLMECLKK